MWHSLPVRLSLTVVALLLGTVILTLSVSHRVAADSLAEQGDRAATSVFSTLSVSHAGQILGQRSEDIAELQRSAQRLVSEESTGVQAVAFHDPAGRVLVEAHAATVLAPASLSPVPARLEGGAASAGLRRWSGPV